MSQHVQRTALTTTWIIQGQPKWVNCNLAKRLSFFNENKMTRCLPNTQCFPLSVSANHISFSQLSCYASVQLVHSLIHNSCSLLVHPHTILSAWASSHFSPCSPQNCNSNVHIMEICLRRCILHSADASWYLRSSMSLPELAVIHLTEGILLTLHSISSCYLKSIKRKLEILQAAIISGFCIGIAKE